MSTEICGLSLPSSLDEYWQEPETPQDEINNIKNTVIPTGVQINRDSRGRITSVEYRSLDGDLEKLVFYSGMVISAINYYKSERLYCTEEYENEKLVDKILYSKNGSITCKYSYRYYNGFISGITKYTNNHEIEVNYKYDDLVRIIERNIYLDKNTVSNQQYNYDILDRIKEYKDENQRILVKTISEKNELLSYEITDRIGNNILIENHFTECRYVFTKINLNGHSITVDDTSYVDNVMLKKPNACEDDLDLIIANLFKSEEKPIKKNYMEVVDSKSMGLIDKNIQLRTLPISIRKRLLFNMIAN